MTATTRVHAFQTFCIPPLGKPTKDADYSLGDNRPREVQLGQKGDTCWYYSLNIAGRKRYGKTAPEDLEERVNEKAISALRKECTIIAKQEEENLPKARGALKALKTQFQGPFTRNFIETQVLPLFIKILSYSSNPQFRTLSTLDLTQIEQMRTILTGFVNQTEVDDFEDYPEYLKNAYLKMRSCIYEEYLQRRQVSYDTQQENIQLNRITLKAYLHLQKKVEYRHPFMETYDAATAEKKLDMERQLSEMLDKMDDKDKTDKMRYHILHAFVVRDSYQKLGFTESTWDPSLSLDVLAKGLEEHGPHVVSGYFSKGTYYKVPASELPPQDRVEGRRVYYWKKDDPHYEMVTDKPEELCPSLHAITVVGTKRMPNGKEYIYYIDPHDGSDPADIDSQKLYVMSYEKFCQNIRPLEANTSLVMKNNRDGKEYIHMSPVPPNEPGFHYAIYNTLYKKPEGT